MHGLDEEAERIRETMRKTTVKTATNRYHCAFSYYEAGTK